jgi:hypothetical protein
VALSSYPTPGTKNEERRTNGQEPAVPTTVCIDHLSISPDPILELEYLFIEVGNSGGFNMWQIKTVAPWALKFAKRSLLLVGATTLLGSLALVPAVHAQIAISITPPVCAYGYYGYAPYGCAPSGYYGPGYFYGGVFLGVGPWANWGYGHGWGEHRFRSGGGGVYVATRGNGGRAYAANRGHSAPAAHANRSGPSHASAARNSHAAPAHRGAAHGGEPHGGDKHN